MHGVWIWVLILTAWLCANVVGELEQDLIEKDLYKVLGVEKNASKKDIKDAYRRLAKVHHPDKSSAKDRDMNARIFRDVAESYEVLGSDASRREYDNRRSFHRSSEQRFQSFDRPSDYHQGDRRRQQQQRNQQHYTEEQAYMEYMREYEQNMRDFEEYLYEQEMAYMEEMARRKEQGRSEFQGEDGYPQAEFEYQQVVQPFLVGPNMLEGDVMFPYSPILTASDGSHFAMLDADCSFVVSRGDPQRFIGELYASGGDLRRLSWEAYTLIYKSKGAPELDGVCFAGLDRGGVLKIFEGHPEMYDHFNPVWSTPYQGEGDDGDEAGDILGSMYTTYFLELSSSGEASIRAVTVGDPSSQCLWSTTSCNEYVSVLKDTVRDAMSALGGLRRHLLGLVRYVRHEHSEGGAFGGVVALFKGSAFLVFRSIFTLVRILVRFGLGDDDDDDY